MRSCARLSGLGGALCRAWYVVGAAVASEEGAIAPEEDGRGDVAGSMVGGKRRGRKRVVKVKILPRLREIARS
jgi:hypothetical protein